MAPTSRNDHRIILHFDYDCFYASVFEVEQPILKSLPLAVQQKQIIVTCNYEARRRGLHKLQLIKEAKRICPEVVIVLGEDLTKFRDASKALYLFLRAFIWGGRVERLGFDEVFLDVTDMVAYNTALLNPNDLEHSFFHLDRQEPTAGFKFDATKVYGSTYPTETANAEDLCSAVAGSGASELGTRLLVASHLAGYLRRQLEDQKGYTVTVGISTSKLLAKMVGSVHKPNSQTTLLPPYTSTEHGGDSSVLSFLDSHKIRAIPGIGSKLSQKITSYIAASDRGKSDGNKVTVRDVRLFPGMGPPLLDRILGGPGAPRDIGVRVWGLLHGIDNTEVIEARDLPTQISIENSYGRLDTFEAARKEMISLAISLIRRMRTDLTENFSNTDAAPNGDDSQSALGIDGRKNVRWLARPRTIRLSTQPRPNSSLDSAQVRTFSRISHSAPLPQYVFNLDESVDALAERLVQETVASMFRKLHRERTGWNLRVLNLAVTNMVDVADRGRDIGRMFRRQETEHRDSLAVPEARADLPPASTTVSEAAWETDEDEESMPSVPCVTCGALIPHFAQLAHEIYHSSSIR